MKKYFLVIIALNFIQNFTLSQNTEIDLLSALLKVEKNDTSRIKYMVQLSELSDLNDILSYTQPAIELAERKLKQSTTNSLESSLYKKQLALAYNNSGFYYNNNGNISLALFYFNNCLKIQEGINDKGGMVFTLINIAAIYHSQDESSSYNAKKESMLNRAIEYYSKSLKICYEIKDTATASRCLNNIGLVYDDFGNWKLALDFYYKSLDLSTKINFKETIAISYNNIGYVHQKQAALSSNKKDSLLLQSYLAYEKALTLFKEINYQIGIVDVLQNMGLIYLSQNHDQKAQICANEAFSIAEKLGFPEQLKRVYYLNYKIFKKQKNGIKALEMHEKYILFRDSINNQQTRNSSIKNQLKYDYEKKENKLTAEKEKIEIEATEDNKRQNIIIMSVVLGLILVSIFSVFIFKGLQKNKKANKIILSQKHIVEEKQKEIVDSITYAKRIQNAILPPKDYINKYLPNNFILYKPKDIVAGDFYWMEHLENITLIAAADSTGHGVPGAMVSVVCSNALNRAALEFGLRDPGKLLDKTTDIVLDTFAKSGEEIKDGMDISLLAIDHQNKKIFWSGANNPLWYITNSVITPGHASLSVHAEVRTENIELTEIKADKQPIGKSDHRKPFTTHEINYIKGTVFYLMTDGYPDQFGGQKGKKFKYKQLEMLLKDCQNLSLKEQENLLDKAFENWKGSLEQVDDVTIIGIRI